MFLMFCFLFLFLKSTRFPAISRYSKRFHESSRKLFARLVLRILCTRPSWCLRTLKTANSRSIFAPFYLIPTRFSSFFSRFFFAKFFRKHYFLINFSEIHLKMSDNESQDDTVKQEPMEVDETVDSQDSGVRNVVFHCFYDVSIKNSIFYRFSYSESRRARENGGR